MSFQQISFVPQEVRLDLYAGDGATVQVTMLDSGGAAVPLTGEVRAQIRKRRDDAEVAEEFTVSVTANVATLVLTGDQTEALGKFSGAWDVQWIQPGAQPVTLVQGKARCTLDVTRV